MDAREAALKALTARRRSGARLEPALAKAAEGLPARDAALAARLCYGVTQNFGLIDLALKRLVKKTQPQVMDILRLGAYQLWYLDRVPRYALTDEAVRLCKKTAPHAAGLVNAVLQNLPDTPPETDDPAVRHSLPRWFCERIGGLLPPEELEPFFASCNAVPPVYIQRNTLRPFAERPGLTPCGSAPECYRLDDPALLDGLLRDGRGIVADPAAKLAVTALDPGPGEKVWDACAAPGGKTLMAAFSMGNSGHILATDKSAEKLPLIRDALARCAVTNTEVRRADASSFVPDGPFNAVLCDVPCSGFGVLRKKPDIRYRNQTEGLPALQLSILRNAARAAGSGGRLVYCTCTLLPEENEDVVRKFLENDNTFAIEGMETLWPHRRDTDGFFICGMRKKSRP
ncbi:MAG: 16S rRNA (cytosine(967)-C(5))-methyltransferase RsmB [Oscillospiraceae bacterium]|jgi:16S rRNA (cytosine967-C5)-methyltransferase|nr:16S rRNA (cytosine(967)-C(5))-methyltransferase RsmB [Oscillospiraceae bacterium]